MEEHELIELRSDEVQEILGTPPSWMVRWGTTVIVLCIAMLGVMSYVVKYPDIIPASVVITTSQPPTSVVSRSDGNLSKLLVTEKETVSAGAILGIMQSTAQYDDVKKIDALVNTLQNKEISQLGNVKLEKTLILGELQADYYAMVQAFDIYNFTISSGYANVNKGQVEAQIIKLRQDYNLIAQKLNQVKIVKLKQAEDFAAKQRTLFAQGAVSKDDIESANSRIFEVKSEASSLESALLNKELEIGNMKSRITEITQGNTSGNTDKIIRVKETIAALRSAVDRWKQAFLLTAPIAGKVTFFNKFWKEQQFIKAGEEVLVIVPEEKQENQRIIGNMTMPIAGSGKVKEGQRVVMQLANYPYQEFGTVSGTVESISLVSKDNAYSIQVAIPGDKITTSYHKEIPQAQQLLGQAEIITEDRRFIQRIFDKILGLSKKY